MRDPFGLHARRIRRALADHLEPGDTIAAFARDDVNGDDWVLTGRELIQLHKGAVAARVSLDDATGEVSYNSIGVTVQIGSRRAGRAQTLITFRKPNDLTRRLASIIETPK